MAKTKISEFSSTPANNTDIDSINIAEGCAPSNINDAIRELMAQLKDFQIGSQGDSFNGPIGTSTAAAGAFTTLSASSTVTLSGGTANGVTYLNGSKVLTSGSALTFDGTTLANTKNDVTGATELLNITRNNSGTFIKLVRNAGSGNAGGLIGADSVGTYYAGSTTANMMYVDAANTNLQFYVNSAEGMRLTTTGLGIGTSSPAYKLDVVAASSSAIPARLKGNASGNNNTQLRFAGNNSGTDLWAVGTEVSTSSTGTAFDFYDLTAGANRMRLDSSGNLGLGVTPSAWGSGWKTLQIGAGANFVGRTGVVNQLQLIANGYYNGTNYIYQNTGEATQYFQTGGYHAWGIAPSGTAGNAITFTQAATLDASGYFMLGRTSALGSALFTMERNSNIGPFIYFNDTNTTSTQFTIQDFRRNGTQQGAITGTNNAIQYNTSSDYRLKNITGPITTSGVYIDSLNPVEGTWKTDGSTFVGLIAHEVQEASRTQVTSGIKDGAEMQAMDYSNSELIANLIAEVKSLRQRVATLEAQ